MSVPQNKDASRVYWLTGLSGAGKSTHARRLVDWLRRSGRTALLLDGDDLREALGAGKLFSLPDRYALAFCYARLCRLLALQQTDVVIATISLFADVHAWNRVNLPGYVEILLDTPLEVLRRRDPKGLYAQSDNGFPNVAGIDLAIDMPKSPDIALTHRDRESVDMAFARLLVAIERLPGVE